MTTFNTILIIADPAIRFWVSIVGLILLGLAFLGLKLTKGLTAGYLKSDIGENLKGVLVFMHGLVSLIIAFILPNNYLNEISFIKELYEQNGLWIAFSILILTFLFIIIFGSLLTLLTRLRLKNKYGR